MKVRSAAIDYIKGLAVLSVISAHCNSVFNSTSAFADVSSLILQNIGTFGVICFMVISGMLFRMPVGNTKVFWLKKLKTILIPWIVSGTCVWLYVYLRKPPLTLSSWANFLIGNGSYLYYLTILMLFYVIFSFLPFMRTNAALLVCEAVTAISCIWRYQIGDMTPYLNPLNWIGFFALGMHIALYRETFSRLFARVYKLRWIVYLLCLVALVMQILRRDGGFYWGGFRAIVSWLGAGSMALLGITLSRTKQFPFVGLLQSIGEKSLFIYLWHMPVAGITANLLSRGVLQPLVLLRPLIVLVIVFAAYQIARLLLKKMKLMKWGFLIGIGQ